MRVLVSARQDMLDFLAFILIKFHTLKSAMSFSDKKASRGDEQAHDGHAVCGGLFYLGSLYEYLLCAG